MKKIVVNGTFDVIHPGHLALLNYAKSLGDFLIVAIDTDERVRQLKGPTRPINSQTERKLLLENLKAVDQVVVFDSPEELISIVQECNIMVKGSDYKGKSVIGETHCQQVIYYDRTEHSTTKAIQHIINRGQRA
jgi:D-beta-D-heptose 7-phosphate kinase/D-beta-D-heptose 1-phosphate adenosyltransferase